MSDITSSIILDESFSLFIQRISVSRQSDLNKVINSISEIEEEICQTRAEIKCHESNISDLKNEISDKGIRIRSLYSDLISHVISINKQLTLGDILDIWNYLLYKVPSFRDNDINKVTEEKLFLESVNLNIDLVLGVLTGRIPWSLLDDLLNNRNTGESNYDIRGGLEIYTGQFPIEDQFIPGDQTPCLYMLKDSQLKVIYVGKSASVRKRLNVHWREQSKEGMHSWEIIRMISYRQMDLEEHRLIMRMQPKHNKTMKNLLYSRYGDYENGQFVVKSVEL